MLCLQSWSLRAGMAQTVPAQVFLNWRRPSVETKQRTTRRGGQSWVGFSSIGQTTDTHGRQKENRSRSAGKVGEGEGAAEEGCLETTEPITHIVLHSCSSENYRQLCCLSSMP